MKTGDKIPEINLKRIGENGMEEINMAEYIKAKKVILFAVPGAFTPSCDQKHLPGYVSRAEEIKGLGIDEIICIAVNDPFVMKAWGESAGATGKVTMLPDGNAMFTKAAGMDVDLSAAGLGTRSKRYSALIENGIVKKLNVEESPGNVDLSSADTCTAWLK
ncbi:MAG: peroxiredoxin [Alphaproteobacteria bacterium]|nr:peroxiredoxin [Alphaproteobacteria bacterium]